jgi:preprotein translocase subunit SecA
VIYEERRKVLYSDNIKDYIHELMEEVVDYAVDTYLNEKLRADEWDFAGFRQYLDSRFSVKTDDLKLEEMRVPEIKDSVLERMRGLYEEKEKAIGQQAMRYLERMILLQVIDTRWKEHLYAMDGLREGIGLRAYGQRDPLIEYQHEGYDMFMEMIDRIKEETLEYLFKVRAAAEERKEERVFDFSRQRLVHEEKSQFEGVRHAAQEETGQYRGQLPEEKVDTYHRDAPKVGRNDQCPCGSGKKYKKCCGK